MAAGRLSRACRRQRHDALAGDWADCMKLLALLMIAVSTISAMVSAQAVSDPGTVAVISALEHEWTEAQSSNNDRALDLIFDNSLIYVEYGRLVTKGAYLARIKTEASKVDQVVTESFQVHTFDG